MKRTKKSIVVFYHQGCTDGFGAAWAAWKRLGSKAEYIGAYHNDTPDLLLKGKEVYLVDICFSAEVLTAIKKTATSITIIDHHKSNAPKMRLASASLFDLKHSGAVLSWMFFHPKQKVPSLLLTVEDIDIWNWKRKYTDEIMEYSTLVPMKFKEWDQFLVALEKPASRKKIIEQGKLLVRDRDDRVNKLIHMAAEGKIGGKRALIVNSPVTIDHTANYIYKNLKYPVAVIWSRREDKIVVSLRSNSKTNVDVSKIAAKYGGGGHKSSAAFVLPANDFKTIQSLYKK